MRISTASVAEDEDLRIKALREELMRHIETAKNEAEGVKGDLEHRFDKMETDVKNLKWWFMALVGVFGFIGTILALFLAIAVFASDLL